VGVDLGTDQIARAGIAGLGHADILVGTEPARVKRNFDAPAAVIALGGRFCHYGRQLT
jgi:hypothetical protein